MKWDVAMKVAEAFVGHLRPVCRRVEIAGSLRRLKPDVGDIEILVVPDLTPVPRARLEFGKPIPRAYETRLDQLVDEMRLDKAIAVYSDGSRYKKLWINYAGIQLDLFINLAPSEWGVQKVIRTGPSDFSHWMVSRRKIGGALPNGFFVKHQVCWNGSEIDRFVVPENADRAVALLTETNHVPMPEEADFFRFCGMEYLEPQARKPIWGVR